MWVLYYTAATLLWTGFLCQYLFIVWKCKRGSFGFLLGIIFGGDSCNVRQSSGSTAPLHSLHRRSGAATIFTFTSAGDSLQSSEWSSANPGNKLSQPDNTMFCNISPLKLSSQANKLLQIAPIKPISSGTEVIRLKQSFSHWLGIFCYQLWSLVRLVVHKNFPSQKMKRLDPSHLQS